MRAGTAKHARTQPPCAAPPSRAACRRCFPALADYGDPVYWAGLRPLTPSNVLHIGATALPPAVPQHGPRHPGLDHGPRRGPGDRRPRVGTAAGSRFCVLRRAAPGKKPLWFNLEKDHDERRRHPQPYPGGSTLAGTTYRSVPAGGHRQIQGLRKRASPSRKAAPRSSP